MKNKASVLTLRIPNELKHRIEKVADQQGLSINQLALYAFTKEIQELENYNALSQVWAGKTKKELFAEFDAVLAAVPEGTIPEWDRIEE